MLTRHHHAQRGGLDTLLRDYSILPDISWTDVKLAFALDVARGLAGSAFVAVLGLAALFAASVGAMGLRARQ